MLKKHNKLVMLLVLVTFMFSIVGSAGAANFSDVTGNDVEAAAIYKLNALGVIDGYPNGSFQPEKTITRAEFAKVACVIAGLKDVASGMGDVPSSFSDVPVDFWGNGWINVAAAQGFVKGYPDGTFGANAQITQAEVITVLLRILGYNDNLTGNWPSDYIAKAANIELLDDVTFVANGAATRGVVAILGSATLDADVVDYKASDNIFESKTEDGKNLTLLADKFDDSNKVEDALVLDIEVGDDPALIVAEWYTSDKDDDDLGYDQNVTGYKGTDTINLADEYVVAGADNILGVANRMVDYVMNDDDEIVYVGVKDYEVITSDTVEVTSTTDKTVKDKDDKDVTYTKIIEKVKVEGNRYDMADGFVCANMTYDENYKSNDYLSDTKAQTVLDTASAEDQNGKIAIDKDDEYEDKDMIDVVLNDDGDVVLINAYHYFVPAIVDDVTNTKNTKKISFKEKGAIPESLTKNMDDDDIFVEKNGVPATLDDIEENDLVVAYKNYRGVDYYINAFNGSVEGSLNAVKAKTIKIKDVDIDVDIIDKLTVGDETYKAGNYTINASGIASGVYLFVDGGDDVDIAGLNPNDINGEDEYDLFDLDIKLLLTPANRVAAIISDSEGDSDTGRIYGTVIETHEQTYFEGELRDLVKIYRLNDGKEATYAIDDDAKIGIKDRDNSYKDFDYVKTDKTHTAQIKTDDFIYFSMTSDGLMNRVTKVAYNVNYEVPAYDKDKDKYDSIIGEGFYAKVDTVDTDVDTIKINGKWYEAEDAVFANIKQDADSEETEDASWKDVKDYIDDEPIMMSYYAKDNKLKYAVVNVESLSSDSEVAVVKSHGKDSDGWYVTLVEGEEYVKYYVNDNSEEDTKSLSSGTALRIKWDAGEVDIINDDTDKVNKVPTTTIENNAYLGTIDDINNNSVVLKVYNSTTGHYDYPSFLVDEDTKYFDVTDTDEPFEMSKDDLAKGSDVTVVLDIDVSGTEKELDQPIKGVIVTD